jgi:hypothetical protein
VFDHANKHSTISDNVILSRYSDNAWCAKLVEFLAVIGVEDGIGSWESSLQVWQLHIFNTWIWGIHQALLVR